MPKKIYTLIQLPREQPDKCKFCPLVGIIPDDERRSGMRERYYCLGVYDTMKDDDGNPILDEDGNEQMNFPRLKTKRIDVSARKVKEGGHLLHRPCDLRWQGWMTLQDRQFGMPVNVFIKYRQPYELEQMIKNQPKFNFRRKIK